MTDAMALSPEVLAAFRQRLPAWFRRHRRRLPWRTRRTAYRVWISELMLQQTQVDTVIPYYHRFLRRFPSLQALAAAGQHDVLKLWEGLGYYSRARHAHAAAMHIVAERGGRFPNTLDGLRSLPGVGPYTAAAFGSLAFGLVAAVVDGNVMRVLARAFAYAADIKTAAARQHLQDLADALLPHGRAGEFNEALMELGALVCTPRAPACPACPLRGVCLGRRGRPEDYPVRPATRKVPHKLVGAGVVTNARGEFLIAQRREGSMLGGLWEFPGGTLEPGETMTACIARELKEELGIEVEVGGHLVTVRHAFSHFTMDLHAHWGRIRRGRPRPIHCAAFAWEPLDRLDRYAFGKADREIIAILRKREGKIENRKSKIETKPKAEMG